MALTREQIRKAPPALEKFAVPEWGDEPLLLAWPSVREMVAMQDAENFDGVDMLIACAVDEDGTPLFTSDDREWLESKPGGDVFARIVSRIAEKFGELEKNLESAPAGATPSS